jgi:signal transduction histidine kinase
MSAVRTLDGESVLDGGDYIREDLAVAAESNGFVRGLTLRVGLKPAAVDLFLPGGFPGSRLPALMALLGAIAMMVAVSFVLLRREAELHRMRARFVSGVSHELRTPLSQIRMFAETLMLGRARSDAERRRSLEIIDQEARRLGIMVENILTFSRGERGGVKITPEVTRISTEIQGVVRDFQALPRARRAEVRLELQDDVMVPVDRDALRQIVNNLVDNAVKYGPDGQRITVGLAIFDRAARLWVDDEGPGIPPADREHVFQSFFRLRRDEESRTAGSGIGLSVVRELAALHGGRAWVADAPGGGTRLMVAFPEADLAAAERAAAAVA